LIAWLALESGGLTVLVMDLDDLDDFPLAAALDFLEGGAGRREEEDEEEEASESDSDSMILVCFRALGAIWTSR
jgi:hypothetical protein